MTNHREIDEIRSFAETIRAPNLTGQVQPTQLVTGVVIGLGPGSVSVLIRGSYQSSFESSSADDVTPAVGVRFLSSYRPIIGDTVWILKQGGNALCLGKVQVSEGLEGLESMITVGAGDSAGYQNGWQAFVPPFRTMSGARYWKDPDGWVHLEGVVENPTGAGGGTAIMILEEGYRPSYDQYMNAVRIDSTGLIFQSWRVVIQANGIVVAGTDASGSSHKDMLCLGGMRWITVPGEPYDRVHEWIPFGSRRNLRTDYTNGWAWDRSAGQHIEIPGEWHRWDGLIRLRGKLVYSGSDGATDHRLVSISERASKSRWNRRFQGVGIAGSLYTRTVIDAIAHERVLFRAASNTVTNELSLDGFQWFADIPEHYWTPLTFLNGWQGDDGGSGGGGLVAQGDWTPEPGFYRDQYGVCHLRGVMYGGTTTINTNIAQLPADCRPYDHVNLMFPAYVGGGASAIGVDGTGMIYLVNPQGLSPMSLDQISFRTDPRAEEP